MSSRKLFNIMLSALMVLGINTTPSEAQSYGKNGVAYVLLNEDFSPAGGSGVYRFNDASGNVCTPFRVFQNLSSAQGLSADQSLNTKLYLMKPSGATGSWRDASVGYLPTGITFAPDSDIYLKVALPSELRKSGSTDDYSFPASAHGTSYFKKNYTISGTSYPRAVVFGGPKEVKYLNCKNGTTGCPLWTGSGHIAHPSDNHKIILPSHYCAVSYYLIGTNNTPYQGQRMDGKGGRPLYMYNLANNMGDYNPDIDAHNNLSPRPWGWSRVSSSTQSGHRCDGDQYIGAIIKRVYQLRDKTLDMYNGIDTTNSRGSAMPATSMTLETTGVLATNDVKVSEYYGKTCGDDCIPGDAMPDTDVAGFLSTINVLSTTTGRRYGYNREGNASGGGSNAALRVIRKNGSSYTTSDIRIDGSYKNTNITNGSKFSSASAIKNIGVSSRFTSGSTAIDYIYGSSADKFVVQDSWWGQGGVAYEYDQSTRQVTKYDYTKNNNAPGENVGYLSGIVDAIGIDGDAYLYALKTEVEPNNSNMTNAANSLQTSWPDATLIPYSGTCTVGGKSLPIKVSCWKRTYTSSEGIKVTIPYIPPSAVQIGDFREVTIKQKVKKVLERYPDATSQMGNAEYRGEMLAGYDSWTNRITRGASGNYWQNTAFDLKSDEDKVSDLTAELAVVNIADHPTYISGTPYHYLSAQKVDGTYAQSGAIVSEQGKFIFKVEGYKPNGMSFKNVGDMNASGVNLTSVRINSIQNANGEHSFDENNDYYYSGYPSTMFEASGKYTKVYWTIYQVENSSVDNYKSNPKIIKTIEYDKLVQSGGTDDSDPECKLTYQFKDPGRYIVKARIVYNNFTYSSFTTATRPDQLVAGTATEYTEPMLVQVSANDLNLNQSPSYITKVSLSFNNKKTLTSHGSISGNSTSNFDCGEGTELGRKFGDLTISFDAQFFREEYDNSLSNFKTYDGVGVWDYRYYKTLFEQARDRGLNIKAPSINSSYAHVYNYNTSIVSPTRGNINSIYKQDTYNPGKVKQTPGVGDYRAGTQVSGAPNSYDKSFIQWALYLRPIQPQQVNIPINQMVGHGECLDFGTCENWNVAPTSGGMPRQYTFTYTIKDIDSKINVPRDPASYTIDLEIVYPRVTWLSNQLSNTSSGSNKYYSSIVPKGPNTSPIHVLSNLNLNPVSGDTTVNQSNYDYSGGSLPTRPIFNNPPSVSLCVRDVVEPDHNDISVTNLFETTGDPKVPSASFNYFVSDNNPFMQILNSVPSSGLPTIVPLDNNNSASLTNARKGTILYLERLKTTGNRYDEPADKSDREFFAPNGLNPSATYKTVNVVKSNNSTSFYTDNNWNIRVNYTETVNNPSNFNPVASNVDFTVLKTRNITVDNWVGTLNYTLANSIIYDGLGKNGANIFHYLWNDDAARVSGYPGLPARATKLNKGVYKPFLTRIDNDPPSIKVDLISQNDNQRWEYQLLEGVNDNARCPNNVNQLAKSRLIVKRQDLITNSGAPVDPNTASTVYANANIPGTTNVYGGMHPTSHPDPLLGCNPTVTVPNAGKPIFRTSARLMVNVDIFDNCGFKALREASISVTGSRSGTIFPVTNISKEASHNITNGVIKAKFSNSPRGTFAFDLPSRVIDGDNIRVTVTAVDNEHNKRVLIIPIDLRESSFEARVLESKEQKVNDLH